MDAMDHGSNGDEAPDLDLDRPATGDAQVAALFREGLRAPAGAGLDPRRIEQRARRKHRRRQAAASGVVTAAAAMAAVLVVVSPWSGGGDRQQGTPAAPTTSASATVDTSIPAVTASSLLKAADLGATGTFPKNDTFRAAGAAEDVSGQDVIGGVCVDGTLNVTAPEAGWERTWTSTDSNVPPEYSVTEKVWQWPGQPDQASAALDQLREQVADCVASEGEEGRGVTTEAELSTGTTVPVLVTTASDGVGGVDAQGIVVWGDALVVVSLNGTESALGEGSGVQAEAAASAGAVLGISVARLAGNDPASSPLWVSGDGQ